MTDDQTSLPAPQDRAEPTPTDAVIRKRVKQLLADICADGGEERFISDGYDAHEAIVDGVVRIFWSMLEVAAPARAHQEEKGKEMPDDLARSAISEIGDPHPAAAMNEPHVEPCDVCEMGLGTHPWTSKQGKPLNVICNACLDNEVRYDPRGIRDPQPAAVSDAGSQNDCAETTCANCGHPRDLHFGGCNDWESPPCKCEGFTAVPPEKGNDMSDTPIAEQPEFNIVPPQYREGYGAGYADGLNGKYQPEAAWVGRSQRQKDAAALNQPEKPARQRLLDALATMPEEAFGWLVLTLQPPKANRPHASPWPDGLGGFMDASRAAITETQAAASAYLNAGEPK